MASGFRFELVTPYGMFIEENECLNVVIPAYDGMLGVERGHMPLVVPVIPGPVRVKTEGGLRSCFASHGYAVIEPDEVVMISSAAEWPEEMDLERAHKSLERATERLAKAKSEKNKSRAEHAIRRAQARIHFIEAYRASETKIS